MHSGSSASRVRLHADVDVDDAVLVLVLVRSCTRSANRDGASEREAAARGTALGHLVG